MTVKKYVYKLTFFDGTSCNKTIEAEDEVSRDTFFEAFLNRTTFVNVVGTNKFKNISYITEYELLGEENGQNEGQSVGN